RPRRGRGRRTICRGSAWPAWGRSVAHGGDGGGGASGRPHPPFTATPFRRAPPPRAGGRREAERARIGLLGRLARILCLIESSAHAPTAEEFRACLGKHVAFWEQLFAEAKKKRKRARPFVEPFLWIIAAGRPTRVLAGLKFTRGRGWPRGVYFFGDGVLHVGV